MAVGEVDRDEPRGAEAAPVRQQDQPQPEQQAEQVRAFIAQARLMLALAKRKARRQRPRESTKTRRQLPHRRDFRIAAAWATRPLRLAPGPSPAHRESVRFPPAARAVCWPARSEPQLEAEIEITQPIGPAPAPATDDLDRAYLAERGAIDLDYGRRLAAARTPGERRAIKSARKSALAAARQKNKLLKAGRRAAFAQARQNAPRKKPPRHKPRR